MKINKKFINGAVLVAIVFLIGFIIKDCAKTNLGAVVIEAFFTVIILLAWLTYNEKADNDEKYY